MKISENTSVSMPIKNMLAIVAGVITKFKFSRSRVFEDINQGLRMGYKIRPGMDDPAELMRLYLQAAGKSLTTQNVLRFLETNYIGKSTDILTKPFLAIFFLQR